MNSSGETNYPVPENEEERLETLYRYDILDSAPEEKFDRLVSLGKKFLDVPVCLVSLVDREREWHKSAAGAEPGEGPRDISFCAHAITHEGVLVVPDARKDQRFEDNRSVRRILNTYLEKQKIDLMFASNGTEALSSVRENGVDLVFMDLRMPEKDGLEATKEIREFENAENVQRTPIVMVSGEGVEEREEECLKMGCDAYVMKPIEQKEMLALIQQYAVDS